MQSSQLIIHFDILTKCRVQLCDCNLLQNQCCIRSSRIRTIARCKTVQHSLVRSIYTLHESRHSIYTGAGRNSQRNSTYYLWQSAHGSSKTLCGRPRRAMIRQLCCAGSRVCVCIMCAVALALRTWLYILWVGNTLPLAPYAAGAKLIGGVDCGFRLKSHHFIVLMTISRQLVSSFHGIVHFARKRRRTT
jgi:hypothetical protein